MKVNNTTVKIYQRMYRLALNPLGQIQVCHKKQTKRLTFDLQAKKIIQVNPNEFLSFNETHKDKVLKHYYLFGFEKYDELMSFKYINEKQINTKLFNFSLSDGEGNILYNAEKHIMFYYPMISFSEIPVVINGQSLYMFKTTGDKKKAIVYMNEDLIPVMVQDLKKRKRKLVTLLEGENYSEALDRTIFYLKQDRSLKRVPWKE